MNPTETFSADFWPWRGSAAIASAFLELPAAREYLVPLIWCSSLGKGTTTRRPAHANERLEFLKRVAHRAKRFDDDYIALGLPSTRTVMSNRPS